MELLRQYIARWAPRKAVSLSNDPSKHSSRPSLTSMPEELLVLIVAELDWKDLVRLRKTCKKLRELSFNSTAWRAIFRRYSQNILPRPFFLPGPISECSTQDLERSLANWDPDCALTGPATVSVIDGSEECLEERTVADARLLPGGRWLLVGYKDGSIWYFDMNAQSHKVVPQLLLDSPYGEPFSSSDQLHVVLAVDYTSEGAQGAQALSSSGHHMTQFNLATIASYPNNAISSKINIWKVEVVFEGGFASSLRAVEQLSAFNEERLCEIDCCDLYGSTLAYVGRMTGTYTQAIVVDWKQCAGETDIDRIQRWYLPQAQRVILLPEDRILTVNRGFAGLIELFYWRRDCPPPSPLRPSSHGRHTTYPSSVWLQKFPGILATVIPSVAFLADEIRLIIPVRGHLYGVSIPYHTASRVQEPRVESLLSGGVGPHSVDHGFGYHCMVSMRQDVPMTATRYSWHGEPHEHSSKVGSVGYILSSEVFEAQPRTFFDHFSLTVLIAQEDLSSFHKIELYTVATL